MRKYAPTTAAVMFAVVPLWAQLLAGEPSAPACYTRQATWQDTLSASLAALSHQQDEAAAAGAREAIWRQVSADFPDEVSAREQRIECEAGVWAPDLNADRPGGLAGRYAAACADAQKGAAMRLAQSARAAADVRAVRDLFYVQHAEARLEQARQTLELVERNAPRPALAAELAALEKAAGRTGGEALYVQASRLRRRIILSHPALDFEKLLINKRTYRVYGHMCDQYLGRHSKPGPGLTVLESWKDNPKETVLLDGKLPAGMTYHPDLHWDAQRVVFAFCPAGDRRTDGRVRSFFLYEAAMDGSWVRQLTGTDKDPMERSYGRSTVVVEDFDPCYLPDGGIAFMSTRSQQFGRCHGSRYAPSYCLYRADGDGANVRRLSYNEANEWSPSVLHDGRIIYCRWDYINRHDVDFQSLWVIRPDGTSTGHYYGNYSPGPCMITQAAAVPGSHKTVATGTCHHGASVGTILLIDPWRGEDGAEPLTCVTPECPSPERPLPRGTKLAAQPLPGDVPAPLGSLSAPSAVAAIAQVRLGRGPLSAATPYPLSEELFLVSYTRGSQYAVYLVDTLGGRELIYFDPDSSCFAPIPVRPAPRPPVVPSVIAGKEERKTGQFYVLDVYQGTERIEPGTIKRLRVNQIISQSVASYRPRSYHETEIAKRVLGTVPVGEDGSVAFEAPAGEALQFQLLDENDMAVMTMRSLVYAQPGEAVACVGCHEPRNTAPVASTGLRKAPLQKLVPPSGPRYEGGFSFVRSVQPVLDRYCIGCHGLGRTEGGVDLLGTMTLDVSRHPNHFSGLFNVAYDTLIAKGGVKVARRNCETARSRPKDYFAHAGTLAQMLRDGHKDKDGKPRVQLDRESFRRIVDWLDLNAPFYGDYSFNRAEDQPPLPEGERALREAVRRRFGAELADQPFAALVNVALPAESRILLAPLPREAGGWGQIARGAWRDRDDPAYREMVDLVEGSITPRQFQDVAGTCGRGGKGCRCGGCFARLYFEERQARAQKP